jgi:hypothetical protein
MTAPGIRELLAVVLGVALGLALVVAPRTALRLSVFAGPQGGRRGEYGEEGSVSDRWTWVVRGLGVACLVVASVITYRTFV